MKIRELMTPDVETVKAGDTLHTAAQMMADLDTGVLPVIDNDRVVGMITDRDIAVRAVAKGREPNKTAARDIMTEEVRCCFDDEESEAVARKMGQWQVRRLPVMNRQNQLVGIVSLGDLAIGGAEEESRDALKEISES